MDLHLDLRLVLLLIKVCASLLEPLHVKMITVDRNYSLHWDWSYTELRSPVTFTVEYVYWNDRHDTGLYNRACNGSQERRCDFTPCKLSFLGSYLIRVRAEAEFQQSLWTDIRFIPDEEVHLSEPSTVNVTADIDMLILTISKSVMSDEIKEMHYRVQYWEKIKPEQKYIEDYDNPHAPLNSLKSWTEYCVQVCFLSLEFNTSSNFTSPQCVYTTGHYTAWWRTLAGLLCITPLLGVFLYKCRRKSSVMTTPESILEIPSVPLLLEAQEECCMEVHVIAPGVQPTNTTETQTPESIVRRNDGCEQDSGFSSGLES